jgi:MFS family permease
VLDRLKGVAIDVTPIRESRDFRLLAVGSVCSSLGAQAALVALPYQIYVTSHSAALVGLLGAFELGPMIVVALLSGALADRHDRRLMLATAQVGMLVVVGGLLAVSLAGSPPVALLLVLGGLLAGCTTLGGVSSSSMTPGILGPELMRPGFAFLYGSGQATAIIGPGLGGLLIGFAGVSSIYAIDGAASVVMLLAALAMAPQRPVRAHLQPPVREAIVEGLRFVTSDKALAGSYVIDIGAMMFGMPRALFAVLSLSVYHAGAGGTGALYAAIAVGGMVSVLTSGWVGQATRLGRITIICVTGWGLAIIGAGLVRSIGPAALLLGIAGWADGISAVCRSTISQTLTPDHLRGRTSAVFTLVVTSGPRLGDIESGLVAGLVGALNSVLVGGIGCLVGVGATMLAFPELERYDAQRAVAAMAAADEAWRLANEGVRA